MSNTTSHIETKLSERIRAVASEYNIPLSRDIMVADDMLEQFATDADELESRIEALSRQPVQLVMSTDYEALYELLCKGGEVLGTYIDADGEKFAELYTDVEIVDGKEHFISECRRLKLEWVAPRQPVQTEDLEAKAREWYDKNARYDEVTYPSTQDGDLKMLAAFARSLSEPKSQGFTPTNTTDK